MNYGRIVIPKELRDTYEIDEGTKMEIWTNGKDIVLKKHKSIQCGNCGQMCYEGDSYCSNCGNFLLDSIGGKIIC